MTILEEPAAQKTSSTASRKQNNVVEDDNRNHIEKGRLSASETNVTSQTRNSINLDETLIRALSSSNNSAMISAVGDRYITPEYLAPLPSSSVSIYSHSFKKTKTYNNSTNENGYSMKHLFLYIWCREITVLIYWFPITNYCVDPFVAKLNYRIENEMFILSFSSYYMG